MFKRMLTMAAVASILVAPAYADPKPRYYQPTSNGYDYARVVNVDPIVRQVRVEVPRRECWTEVVYDQPQQGYRGTAGPTLLGAAIGGVLGHQFEGHSNATLIGALVGGAIGHDIGERRRNQYAYSQPVGREVERCSERIEQSYEERIDGYDVEYEYGGRFFHTRLPYDPGERIRVRVAVTPA
jgi:uncharacterized protein YcfJ